MNAAAPMVIDHETQAVAEEPRTRTAQIIKTDAAKILDVITRAAKDPSTDVDKIDRLMGMYERIEAGAARRSYDAAMADMQALLPVITERGQIVVKEKGSEKIIQTSGYAKWEDINEVIKPVLAAHGFAITFRTGTALDGKITVTCICSHRDGHREETTMTLMHDSTGSKNSVQAIGSSTTYGKRYSACAMLNITTRGQDNDGQTIPDPNDWVTADQVDELIALIDDVRADRAKFLDFFKVETLAHLPAKRLPEAITMLEAKRRA